ncbi:Subtilisin-like serine protease [Natrarchaeobaculum sulfurireducens]|uniref:Subtilisin-like serine protease n=1 Tax=Natrarchaeobaculum sulfurireducens TaxID=2044521 RepID=A0A346PIY6_9EURY|nr:Subtilisin-like serine protease [Natrarchaeobaculum sulfurireducens]
MLTVSAVVVFVLLVGSFAAMPTADDGADGEPRAENLTPGPTGDGVTVAVVDTGIDDGHVGLEGRVVDRIDLTDDGDDADSDEADVGVDEHGHGTHVAGIVAGSGEGEDGDAGLAPGAALVDVRVLSEEGEGDADRIADGIEYAVDEAGADIVVLSLNVDGVDDEPIDASVAHATEQGTVVVASAGNSATTRSITTPGATPEMITVGATAKDGSVLEHSSRGPTDDGHLKPELVAPGEDIPGPAVGTGEEYTTRTGTSVAAPQVAATAALLLETEPSLSPQEIESRLASTARPLEGADVYAAGAGKLDVDRALEPNIVVDEGVIDFGLVDDDEPVTQTVTVENHDDQVHDLSLEADVTNLDIEMDGGEVDGDGVSGGEVDGDGVSGGEVDGDGVSGDKVDEATTDGGDAVANETLSVNRSELTLEPGERAAVELTVDADADAGVHSGALAYAVDGEPRTVPVGFVRGGEVTVEKRPLSAGDRVDGDPLFFFSEDGTHSGIQDFEDGETSFVGGGGTYVLWSKGVDQETGSIVFLSERVDIDGEKRVVLDESETIPVGVDAEPIVEKYGPLENNSVVASMSTMAGDSTQRLSRTLLDADNRTVRVSEDPDNAIATTYLLTPDSDDELETADVFQLHHETSSAEWASPVEISPSDLETTAYRIHRPTQDLPLEAQDRTTTRFEWNDPARYWFELGDSGDQRVHRTTTGVSHDRELRGDGWRAIVDDRTAESTDVLAHPLTAVVDSVAVENHTVTIEGEPLADGAGTELYVSAEHSLTTAVGDEVVDVVESDEPELLARDVPIDHDEPLTVELAGNNSDGWLSTNTKATVTIDEPRPGEPLEAPLVRDVDVDADETNAAGPGEVTVALEVDDLRSVSSRSVWYAPDGPETPPWDESTGWERADTGYEDGRLTATLDVPEDADTVSLAAELEADGDRVRTMTADAFYAGEAPNTSTRTISGQLLTHDGTPADNDTVLAAPVDGDDAPTIDRTDEDGTFDLEVPADETYTLAYRRGEPWQLNASLEDERPAFAALDRVTVDEDVTLEETLLRATPVDIEIVDERGEAVPNATVELGHRAANASVGATVDSDADGMVRLPSADESGISLSGAVTATIDPPEEGPYVDRTYRTNVTVDEPRSVTVEIETEPPEASLETNREWMLEGTPVTLDAGASDVQAGAEEYRWDLTGDGSTDEVTPQPVLRHEPEPGTTEVTVTVVDEAGATDDASATVRVDPLEE